MQNASLFAITPLAVSEDEVTSIDDFDVVQGVSRDDYVLVASKGTGFTSIDDFAGADKKITYGTTGVGTGAQLACALTFNVNDTPAEAIPFDGGAPALTALLGDQVDTACLQVGEAIENIEAGKITPITVFGPERVEFLPDVPTAQESGPRRRGRAVPFHDRAEGHPAGRPGRHRGGHAGDVRDRGVPGLQRAEQPHPDGDLG